MNALRALLADRRRSQQGSVLSAVLIITAFLAIIAGALGTELSTNFLLSRNLVNRVATEATVNSAVELAINQLQSTPLNSPCPFLPTAPPLNGQTAVVSYVSCAPDVYWREPQFPSIATSSSPFVFDGSYTPSIGLSDYVVGASGGRIFDYRFGSRNPRWSLALGGSMTGPLMVMPDSGNGGQFLDLIPMSGPDCRPSNSCISVVSDDLGRRASLQCAIPTASSVVSRPAAGVGFQNIAYFGDTSGNVYALDTNSVSDSGCDSVTTTAGANSIVAGPVVFSCRNGCGRDEVYFITSNGSSSQLVRFTYTGSFGLVQRGSISLPGGTPLGIAVETTSLPSRLAISFAGGQVAIVQLNSNATMGLAASVGLPTSISGAPYWCHCPGSVNLIGIGGRNGSLYVLDTNLNRYATYAGGPAITTAPAANGAGDWYFGASDGRLYEVQKPAGGTAMVLGASFGSAGAAIGSSPVVAACPVGICVYLGALDGHAYLVSLDTRNAVLNACIGTAPSNCSGANPRLWTRVEVGTAGAPRTVRVQGWSYYST